MTEENHEINEEINSDQMFVETNDVIAFKIKAYDTFLNTTKKITIECLDIDRNISTINQQLLRLKIRANQVASKHNNLL